MQLSFLFRASISILFTRPRSHPARFAIIIINPEHEPPLSASIRMKNGRPAGYQISIAMIN